MSIVNVNAEFVERPTLFGNTSGYSVAEVIIPNAPTPAAGGAGQSVTVSFSFTQNNLPFDLNYCIEAIPSQACSVSYSGKTTSGFNVIFTPLANTTTLVAGSVDVSVTWSRG